LTAAITDCPEVRQAIIEISRESEAARLRRQNLQDVDSAIAAHYKNNKP
jgi:hypothetical protein